MGDAACHMINGKRAKLHLTIKRFWLVICRERTLWAMPFLSQLGKSCQTDYKLHFWCTTRKEHSPACKDGGFVELKVTFGLLKCAKQLVLWGYFWDSSQLCSLSAVLNVLLIILLWIRLAQLSRGLPFKQLPCWLSRVFMDFDKKESLCVCKRTSLLQWPISGHSHLASFWGWLNQAKCSKYSISQDHWMDLSGWNFLKEMSNWDVVKNFKHFNPKDNWNLSKHDPQVLGYLPSLEYLHLFSNTTYRPLCVFLQKLFFLFFKLKQSI